MTSREWNRIVARAGGVMLMALAVVLIGGNLLMAQDAAATPAPETPAATTADAGASGLGFTFLGLPILWYLAPIGAFIAFYMARKFWREVMDSDEGDPLMIEIASYVRTGAMAYLFRQYKVVTGVFVILCLLLAYMAFSLKVQHTIVPFAFLTGGFFSGLCGWIGMKMATNAAHRTTAGARKSLNDGLTVAFRAGAVMGLIVVGFGLIDICGWFLALHVFVPMFIEDFHMSLNEITVVMLTFGMGASTQALFARVGGGIYTKAADVGADLVGKVEAGIPEDDPRNPAAIADNVGDNVGDVAGMGADLYESYCGSILATMALGVAAAAALFSGEAADNAALRLLSVPMVMAGVGIVLSVVGIYMVKAEEGASMGQLMKALGRGVNGSSLFIAIAAFAICYMLLGSPDMQAVGVSWWGIASAVVVGLVAGMIIGKSTEYYTSYEFGPTKEIAEQTRTGAATVIIAGIAEGMKSTWASLATIVVAILAAFTLAGGADEFTLGLYGIGIAAVGMLATLGITLATDAYGPIADNAGGNAEMTGQDPKVRERTDALDSLGNTTAATGKGFAIGSAALTALALLAAYVEEVRVGQVREGQAYVEMHVDDAKDTAAAGIGDIYYIGHGKFGEKFKEGTTDSCYRGYMLLNRRSLRKAFEGDQPVLAVGDKFSLGELSEATKEEEYVQTVEKGGETLHLVNTRWASLPQYMTFYDVTLMNPRVLCGMFCGVLLAFLFCALTMKAVGRAAYKMMLECRSQFDKIKQYLMSSAGGSHDQAYADDCENWPRKQVEFEGSKLPDYANCVAISTAGAQKEMVVPSLLAIVIPVFVGLIFGVPGVMGLLAGGLTSGFAVAIFMANAGGAWDNAKKYIETGQHGGKGSDAHKASVVGDTVGDPFKDTSGPSLNILIKLMSMVSVVFAGLVVKYAPQIGEFLGLGG